eukprot:1427613-Prymnesium_polylepis.1
MARHTRQGQRMRVRCARDRGAGGRLIRRRVTHRRPGAGPGAAAVHGWLERICHEPGTDRVCIYKRSRFQPRNSGRTTTPS